MAAPDHQAPCVSQRTDWSLLRRRAGAARVHVRYAHGKQYREQLCGANSPNRHSGRRADARYELRDGPGVSTPHDESGDAWKRGAGSGRTATVRRLRSERGGLDRIPEHAHLGSQYMVEQFRHTAIHGSGTELLYAAGLDELAFGDRPG